MDSPFASIRSAALDLVQRCDHLVLSTLDGQAMPDTRMLFNLRKQRSEAFANAAVALSNPWATWIATNTSSKKMRELRANPHCCLYYFDSQRFEGLTLQGSMEECLDAEVRKAIWIPSWEMFYPGGLEGGEFSVLRFHPLQGRWYHGLSVCDFDAETQR